ncbi:MAG TPA: 16S rRNA (cytidine(1402)-2'-O)-methyltransferase [Wenzhouxiangellaceae bacterium]|nr:16S rRNA (cytidine(1402)-2'-O)-methyltransferase [Wenzhouxiangellaceae bacterium]
MTRTSAVPGTLWIVATPLGNLDDLSPRARDVLAEADVIAAEDTRVSRKLLPPREKPPRWVALHEHNESRAVEELVDLLLGGLNVALVSDAGTPLISDPGYRLVDRAHQADIRVSPVPGPCAAIAALSAAGLPSDRFCFEGFLPARASQRRKRLETLSRERATLMFYVPARDLFPVLTDAASTLGANRLAAIGRELTKRFETIRRGRLEDLAVWVQSDPDQQRGEAVLLIEGAAEESSAVNLDTTLLARELALELPPARAARILVRVSGMGRRDAFSLVESVRGN